MPKHLVYSISFLTLFGFGGLSWILLHWFNDQNLTDLIEPEQWPMQLGAGIGFGLITAFAAKKIISSKWVQPSAQKYEAILARLHLNKTEVIVLSICAGVGEELFFRGFLQGYLGLWTTSILFVAIHGYLNPRDWRISIYGGAMVFVIVGFGLLFDQWGIIAPALAHFVFDLVLLWDISNKNYEETIEEDIPVE
jgi:membrane protease YdiL (CAAX protease family)